jgi:hypothetical protein
LLSFSFLDDKETHSSQARSRAAAPKSSTYT